MAKLLKTIKVVTGYEKLNNFLNIVEHNGGLLRSLKKMYLQDDLKIGTLVGKDQFGNSYYENPYYFVPRNRWVEFNEKVHLDYDASQIPPEWHRWLTNMTEYPPTVDKPVKHPWMLEHEQNLTGTSGAYLPYSTVKPKIQSWKP